MLYGREKLPIFLFLSFLLFLLFSLPRPYQDKPSLNIPYNHFFFVFLRNFLLLQTNEKKTIFKPNANYLSEWNAIKCLVISITYGPRNFKHCQSTEERERERAYL